MLETLKNAWKIQDLRKKIIYTLLMLLIYRVGAVITVPGVNASFIAEAISNNSFLTMMNFVGSNLTNYSIFAMGIQPYITASIVMNLLTVAIPYLERLQKEGEDGRKKIAQYTRYVTVVLGFIQAIGITLSFGADAVTSTHWLNYLLIGLSLAAGTAFVMWLGERITENGVGNGISLLIFIGVIGNFPQQIITGVLNLFENPSNWWMALVMVVFIVVLVACIVFVDEGERRIPVQYAKRVVGRRMYGGNSSHIPMKVNSSGVMPLIFAMTILSFPGLIATAFFSGSAFDLFFQQWFSRPTIPYTIVFAILIVFFAFFYASISFNPVDIAKNIQQNGGFIPGIRPGKSTSDYLAKVSNRITLIGAIFLALVATIPSLLMMFLGVASPFTATGILIVVSVALETSKQIEAQILMRHYKGFLR